MRGGLGGAFGVALTLLALIPARASAEQVEKFAYPYKQVWSAAVRLLRVDLGHKVTERDEEVGFIVFDYRDDSRKSHHGTAQLAAIQEGGREVIRVELSIQGQPSYIEIMVLTKLARKLRDEYGDPLPVKKKPKAKPEDETKDDEREGQVKGRGRARDEDGRDQREDRPRDRERRRENPRR